MRSFVPLVVVITLSGCASQQVRHDPLCVEIAAFANAIPPGQTRMVSLETSWGSSKNHHNALYSRDCQHGGFEPGKRLCRFLMEHSSLEIPYNNYRAAFACLSNIPARTRNFVSYERLDTRVSAFGAAGVKDDVEVSLEFKPNEENGTMQLDIGAAASAPPR